MQACKVAAIGLFATILGNARAGIIGPGAATVAAVASATPVATVAQPPATTALVRGENYDPHPRYSFSYSVADSVTGDNKAQQETRNGDVVQGSYSLIEPDGSRRVVSYAADPINGFNAVVQKDPSIALKSRAVVVPVATALQPAAVASPLITRSAVPAALAVRSQPIAGPALTTTNVATANIGVLGGLGLLGLGLRPGTVYDTQALLTGAYGTGGIFKVH